MSDMITWAEGSMPDLSDYEDTIDAFGAAYADRTFPNVESNVSIRSQTHSGDYYSRRQNEANPTDPHEIMRQCDLAYRNMGIIRQIIDLMSEFSCHSIRLKHPNKSNQAFYDAWWDKVKGEHTSERFLNMLYRLGNVPVYRTVAKLSRKQIVDMKTASASEGVKPNIVPVSYYFINPVMLRMVDKSQSMVTKDTRYRLMMSTRLLETLSMGRSGTHRDQRPDIPAELQNGILNSKFVDLDPEKLQMFFYKKDDWDLWAYPVIYPILSDIKDFNKMRLADRSALDGAISNIRLWTLGNIEQRILPNRAAVNKLRNILDNNVAGGTMDIVWGPDLSFKETNSQVYRFLGAAKYEIVLNSMYEGMGIPPALRGGAGKTMSNNFVSLQTFIKRLEYGRAILTRFWNNEIRRVQMAMGFQKPAQVVFDNMYLGDESSEKRLLVELADRNLISQETLLEHFGITPNIEKVRVHDDERERDKGTIPHKAGPYHNAQKDHDLKKIALQSGVVTPSEVGLELEEKTAGEESALDKQAKIAKTKTPTGTKPVGKNGRPPGKKDTKGRKPRTPKVLTKGFVNDMIWAVKAQTEINKVLLPVFAEQLGKNDIRKFTNEEKDEFEYVKMHVLANTTPYSEITIENVYKTLNSTETKLKDFTAHSSELESDFMQKFERSPNLEEKRQIYASAYAKLIGEDNGEY